MNRNVWIVACMCMMVFGQAFSRGKVEKFLDDHNVSYKTIVEQKKVQVVTIKEAESMNQCTEGFETGYKKIRNLPVEVFSPGYNVMAIRMHSMYRGTFWDDEDPSKHLQAHCIPSFKSSKDVCRLAAELYLTPGYNYLDRSLKMHSIPASIDEVKKNLQANKVGYFARNLYDDDDDERSETVGDVRKTVRNKRHAICAEIGKIKDPNSKFDGALYILYTRIDAGPFTIEQLNDFDKEKEFLRKLSEAVQGKTEYFIQEETFPKVEYKKQGPGFFERLKMRVGGLFSGSEPPKEEEEK